MILVDLNQVLLAGLMAQISNDKKMKLEEGLIRHLSLNILRTHIKHFKGKYGEIVLACDNRKYWRKEFFPYYKAGRKKTREKSSLDWHLIFDILAKIKQELKDYFPYKVIDVEGAEADDVIGTLVPYKIADEDIVIVSSDGDFLQLQKFNSTSGGHKVKQYNPAQKKYIVSENPLADLKEKIISGDKGDGIPNILSASDCFVTETRQTPITKPKMQKFMDETVVLWEDEKAKNGFSRNKVLIDLSMIPTHIQEEIINTYNETKPGNKQKLLNYFIQYKLKNLMDVIEDF